MTFRGVFRDRCNLELLSCIEAAYIHAHACCVSGGGGERYVAGSRTLWTVHQSSRVYVLDSGQRSSVTVNHPHHLHLLLLLLFRGLPGGVSEKEEDEDEEDQGRIELEPPPFLVARVDVLIGCTCACE